MRGKFQTRCISLFFLHGRKIILVRNVSTFQTEKSENLCVPKKVSWPYNFDFSLRGKFLLLLKRVLRDNYRLKRTVVIGNLKSSCRTVSVTCSC